MHVKIQFFTSFVIVFLLLAFESGIGQDTKYLNLGDAISIALEKSYEMKVARLEKLGAEKNLIWAKSNFKLRVDANLDIPSASEQVQEIQVPNQLPYFNTTGEMRYQGNLSITQPLPTDGQFSLQGRSYHRSVSTWSDLNKDEQQRDDVLTSLSLTFNQPLFTLNDIKTNLKQANLRYESSVKRYKRDELDIVYNVTASFFALYRAKREVSIATDNVKRQEELAELASKKYDAGLIPEVEALQMEVDLAESRTALVAAKAAQERMSDSFKQLVGLQFSDNVDVISSFEITKINVDLEKAVLFAQENRSEVRLNEIDVELSKLRVKETDAIRDFQGTLSAFYDLTGVASSDIHAGSTPKDLWEKSLEDMKGRPNNRGMIFRLSVPIWDWGGNRAAVQSAEADLRSSELALFEMKKTIERQVRAVVGRLHEAESQLEVLEKREELAKRTFDITIERFNNGDITSQELALDRDRYIGAQVAFLGAYIDYQLALADLKRTTMYDFEYDHSLVE